LKIFSDRLNKAIAFKKIDVSVIAKNLGIAPSDVKKMVAGMREPSMRKLIILANTLGCSVDYLLGLMQEPERADVVILADTEAIKPSPVERGQTSGQNWGEFIAMISELPETDVELLMHLAGFLIVRKGKSISGISTELTALSDKAKQEPEKPFVKSGNKKAATDFDDFDDIDDDIYEEDDIWDEDADEYEDDEYEDEDFDDDSDD
jgi:transcriptional regulator with XRE-family HTH domain